MFNYIKAGFVSIGRN